ncbi:MAG: tRNA (adenosine(37)-N6)-dimethylallyltransferase MiaA, partial [Bacteroidales bacterium]|nr:tRNA (adenosine(37)-N6)-dimethylallyltransferase MiaA [Bacteroidales bacterium]
DNALMVGGSMLYIDAICKGIDDMPDVDEDLRRELLQRYEEKGLDDILAQLRLLDPDYYNEVDRKNHKRVLHGLEICLMTGKPFSSFRRKQAKERPFDIVKICLHRQREELYARIDARVQLMMDEGLLEEARALYPYRHLNALKTVGYSELFAHFDGHCSLEEAIAKIQFNTHKYARKQLTWFRRDGDYHWFEPAQEKGIFELLQL